MPNDFFRRNVLVRECSNGHFTRPKSISSLAKISFQTVECMTFFSSPACKTPGQYEMGINIPMRLAVIPSLGHKTG